MMKLDKRSGYNYAHIIKTLIIISKGFTGRNKIMKELSLNEASARTLLRFLYKNKIIEPTASGHKFTKKGLGTVNSLKKKLSGPYIIKESGITLSDCNVAYVVRNCSGKIKKGIEQRDKAISVGAEGLTTVIFNGKFYMPGMEKWSIPPEIKKCFIGIVGKNDVILIGSAKNKYLADLGVLAAAASLMK